VKAEGGSEGSGIKVMKGRHEVTSLAPAMSIYTGDVQHNVQWRRYLSGRLGGKR
jgi:hypothetical protein